MKKVNYRDNKKLKKLSEQYISKKFSCFHCCMIICSLFLRSTPLLFVALDRTYSICTLYPGPEKHKTVGGEEDEAEASQRRSAKKHSTQVKDGLSEVSKVGYPVWDNLSNLSLTFFHAP